jgi:hypothetical protein
MTVNDQQARLESLLRPPSFDSALFPPSSRYAGLATAVHNPEGDRPVVYLTRRFVPRPERLEQTGVHTVEAGQRPDTVAAAALGDAELFWRICDGNRAVFPAELVREPGRRLRLTLPENLPGQDGDRP